MMVQRKRSADANLMAEVAGVLDDGVRDYDAATRHRLRVARETALAEADGSGWWREPALWLGAGAVLVPLAMFWILVLAPWQAGSTGVEPASPELLALAEEGDLYRDLEFYAWLAEQQP